MIGGAGGEKGRGYGGLSGVCGECGQLYQRYAHFIVDNEALGRMDFHYSAYSTFFKDEERFEEAVRLEGLDKSSNQMMLVPTHATGYFQRAFRTGVYGGEELF